MAKTVYHDGDEGVSLIVKQPKGKKAVQRAARFPVHVVYGGADRFSRETPRKLGDIALKTLETYAPDFAAFARAMSLPEAEGLPTDAEEIQRLDRRIARNKAKAREELPKEWFAWSVHRKTLAKLAAEPVEDLRIDFEDGYGFRPDEEEDRDAERSAQELAATVSSGSVTRGSGFRIKSLQPETHARAIRTLDLFLEAFIASAGRIPDGFVATLPKITHRKQVRELADRVRKFEKKHGLATGVIGIELMIETPEAIVSPKGNFAIPELVKAGKGRVTSAHFGAYDYTSALGISAADQHIGHDACNFARQIMLATLAPLGLRVADSVTTKLPVGIHRGKPSQQQLDEDRVAVHEGWAEHFENVTRSMQNGFHQSWDLHPNQLPARFAAVYAFYLKNVDEHAVRLKKFLERSTKATLSGNTFDDAASAQGILNFFVRGIDCGALSEKEAGLFTGLSPKEIRSSFQDIATSRSGS